MHISWTDSFSKHGNHVDFLFLFRQVKCSCYCFQVFCQSSCECLQRHQIFPSIIHGETGMNQKIQLCHVCREHCFFFKPYDTPSFEIRLRNSAKKRAHSHAPVWKSIFIVSVCGIRESNYSQQSCVWPELKCHWLWIELSRHLVKSIQITICWRSWLGSTSGKLVATLKLCPTLHPNYLPKKAPVLCMTCMGTAEIFWLCAFYTGISSNSWITLPWLTSIVGPDWGSFIQRILRLVKSASLQSSEPTRWNFFFRVWLSNGVPDRTTVELFWFQVRSRNRIEYNT